MESVRFEDVKAALQRLLDTDVQSLAGTSDDMRSDGLPQNWYDDCANLSTGQAAELREMLVGKALQWCQSLHHRLLM